MPKQFNYTAEQMRQLNNEYAKIKKIDPNDPAYYALIIHLDALPYNALKQLAEADIKFVSALARNRLHKDEPTPGVNEVME